MLIRKVKQFDLFSETMSFNYRGQERYSTCLGSILSFLVYSLVLLYSSEKFFIMYNYEDTNFITKIIKEQDQSSLLYQETEGNTVYFIAELGAPD